MSEKLTKRLLYLPLLSQVGSPHKAEPETRVRMGQLPRGGVPGAGAGAAESGAGRRMSPGSEASTSSQRAESVNDYVTFVWGFQWLATKFSLTYSNRTE